MKEGLAGLVMAAGLSSRMGAYKPLLEVDGKSMIRHVIDSMARAGASPIVVVTGYRAEELMAHLADEPVEFVHNARYAATQQLTSLNLALAALSGRCTRVMISPADVPLFSDETVQALLEQEGDFIRPICGERYGHPVFLAAKWIPYLRSYTGEGGLRGAMEASTCRIIDLPVADRGTILDNDTPEDFARLLRWHEAQRKKG